MGALQAAWVSGDEEAIAEAEEALQNVEQRPMGRKRDTKKETEAVQEREVEGAVAEAQASKQHSEDDAIVQDTEAANGALEPSADQEQEAKKVAVAQSLGISLEDLERETQAMLAQGEESHGEDESAPIGSSLVEATLGEETAVTAQPPTDDVPMEAMLQALGMSLEDLDGEAHEHDESAQWESMREQGVAAAAAVFKKFKERCDTELSLDKWKANMLQGQMTATCATFGISLNDLHNETQDHMLSSDLDSDGS